MHTRRILVFETSLFNRSSTLPIVWEFSVEPLSTYTALQEPFSLSPLVQRIEDFRVDESPWYSMTRKWSSSSVVFVQALRYILCTTDIALLQLVAPKDIHPVHLILQWFSAPKAHQPPAERLAYSAPQAHGPVAQTALAPFPHDFAMQI